MASEMNGAADALSHLPDDLKLIITSAQATVYSLKIAIYPE